MCDRGGISNRGTENVMQYESGGWSEKRQYRESLTVHRKSRQLSDMPEFAPMEWSRRSYFLPEPLLPKALSARLMYLSRVGWSEGRSLSGIRRGPSSRAAGSVGGSLTGLAAGLLASFFARFFFIPFFN